MSANGFRAYSAYKDSGVEWLGEVPKHWEVRPNKSMLSRRKVLVGEDHPEFDLLSLTKRGVIVRDLSTSQGKFSADPGTCQEVRVGDLVFCLFDIPETPRTVGLSGHHGMITGAYTILECPDSTLQRFLEAFYIAMDDRKLLAPLYSGLRNTIPPSSFLRAKTPVPPVLEQRAIVRYLDRADRRIRRYIRAKERLIELLEERKRAVIHEAVTGRIDVRTGQPYPAYKDSGVEWLGKVPEHWERRRLKTLLRVIDRRSSTGEETLLSLRRDHGVVVYSEHFARPPQGRTLVGYKQLAVGQLVVNRLQANNGLVFCSGVDGLVSPDYSVFDRTAPLQMKYLSDLLRTSTYRSHFRRVSTGLGTGTAGFLRLYDDVFLSTTVFLPPEHEQASVLEYVAVQVRKIEGLIASAERGLELLDEYRTRLIADVVTGKLDVREAVAKLPETDPLAGDRDRTDTLPTESNLHATAQDMIKEASA